MGRLQAANEGAGAVTAECADESVRVRGLEIQLLCHGPEGVAFRQKAIEEWLYGAVRKVLVRNRERERQQRDTEVVRRQRFVRIAQAQAATYTANARNIPPVKPNAHVVGDYQSVF